MGASRQTAFNDSDLTLILFFKRPRKISYRFIDNKERPKNYRYLKLVRAKVSNNMRSLRLNQKQISLMLRFLSGITGKRHGWILYIYNYIYILSKEVGKQYFRVTNDFYLMQLTMMKGGRSQNNTLSNNTQQKNKKL